MAARFAEASKKGLNPYFVASGGLLTDNKPAFTQGGGQGGKRNVEKGN
jgi:hypothetical protein